MKITCINTAHGLVPVDDDSYEEKKRLKVGEAYECDVKLLRNYRFLKKAFALLNAAWSLMDERQQAGWRSKEGFRNYLTVAAGHYDVYYNQRLGAFVEMPASWSFDKMDEATFSDLYDRMKDVIYAVLGDKVTEETFARVLSNF
jgi:hypothetical protein